MLTSISDINRKSYWNRFTLNPVLFQKHSSETLLKKCKKFAKFTGVKRRCWSLFFVKLLVEEQQPYLKETPAQILKLLRVTFYRTHPSDCFCHSQNIFLYNPRPLYNKCVTTGTGDARLPPFPPITKMLPT